MAITRGADAQTLAGTILNDYGTIATTETLGQVKLGGLNAYGVNGATVQKQLEAYLIPTADGCVSVVLCRAGTAPAGWYESLACLDADAADHRLRKIAHQNHPFRQH